jgi:hypothetical protein
MRFFRCFPWLRVKINKDGSHKYEKNEKMETFWVLKGFWFSFISTSLSLGI